MRLEAQRFDALADGAHLLLGSMRLHYNKHSRSPENSPASRRAATTDAPSDYS